MAIKQEKITVTQRMIDNQFIDLHQLAKPYTTYLKVNGTPMTEGVDYTTINGGLFPVKIVTKPDVNGSLNNKYIPLAHYGFNELNFLWFNVNGAGDVTVPYDAMNNIDTAIWPGRGIEVKLNTNDNAIVVGQKIASAIRHQVPEFYSVTKPEDPSKFIDSDHTPDSMGDSSPNSNSSAKIYIYESTSTVFTTNNNTFERKLQKNVGPGNSGMSVTLVNKAEKRTRIEFPFWTTLSTRKIMATTTDGSTKIILDKSFHYPDFLLASGVSVTGTGIPADTTLVQNYYEKSAQTDASVKAKSKLFTGLSDTSNVGHYSYMYGDNPNGFDYLSLNRSASSVNGSFALSGLITDTPLNSSGVVVSECAIDLSNAATATGTVELTLTWGTQLKENDKIIVEYEMDDMGRNLAEQTMTCVAWTGSTYDQTTGNDPTSLDARNATSKINVAYRDGGNRKSSTVLVMLTGSGSSLDYNDFLTDSYNLGARIITPELAGYMTNITTDVGTPQTGVGSVTTAYDNSIFGSERAVATRARSLINFLEKLNVGKVFLLGYSSSGEVVADVARYRPDLVKGIINCDPYFRPLRSTNFPTIVDAFPTQYPVSYGGTEYSITDMNTYISNQVTNISTAADLCEAARTHSGSPWNSMSSFLRTAIAQVINDPFDGTLVTEDDYNVNAIGAPAHSATDARIDGMKIGMSTRPETPLPSMQTLLLNQVPHLIVRGTTGIALSGGTLYAYTYGISNSPGGATVTQKSGHPGPWSALSEIAAFIA